MTSTAPVPAHLPHSFAELEKMAMVIAKGNLFGAKTTEQALSIMLLSQAEGIHPMTAIRDYHIIDGKPTLRADAMLARFQDSGGRVEWLVYTDAKCEAKFTHPAGGSVTIDWTQDRAKEAGLLSRKNWQGYPRQMLRARVISEGVRTVYPGSSSGVYTPEEVADMAEAPRALTLQDAVAELSADAMHKLDAFELADHLAAIDGASDLEDLKRAYRTAFSAAKTAADADALTQLEKAKDARKAVLGGAAMTFGNFLVLLGGAWFLIGGYNLYTLFSPADVSSAQAFGLFYNMLLFILPGAVVIALGNGLN